MSAEQLTAVIACACLLFTILELVRRKWLQERYALLWLLASLVLLVLSVWRGLLSKFSFAVGIHYPPSALFVTALGFELVLLLHFSLAVSRLAEQNKVLAQRHALMQQELTMHSQQLAELSAQVKASKPVDRVEHLSQA